MHFLKANGLLNFASRGDLRPHRRGRRAKFDSRMMHDSPVYHPKFAPHFPHYGAHLRQPVSTTTAAASIAERIFDSRPRYIAPSFSFSFCPEAFRSSPPRTPPLRSRTSATRIYGPSPATSSLKASSSLSSSSSAVFTFTFAD